MRHFDIMNPRLPYERLSKGSVMPINILVNGAFGRMGQMTVKAISEHPDFVLVGQTGHEYDLKKSIKDSNAQVVIDFTHPESVFANATTIIDLGVHPVIGTTGLTSDQILMLQEKCDKLKLGGIIAPNFSLGAVLMMKYARQIVKYMPHVEIIEMHHENKADSPSGTALRTAEILAEDSKAINQPQKSSREIVPGARGANYHDIPIHAVRLPGLLAHEQIIFGNIGETLTLRHDCIDRLCFMPGVCFACEKVITLNRLIYGLEEILN
jgi:4-hydroxy-tetrahydrodipicolinate reductase